MHALNHKSPCCRDHCLFQSPSSLVGSVCVCACVCAGSFGSSHVRDYLFGRDVASYMGCGWSVFSFPRGSTAKPSHPQRRKNPPLSASLPLSLLPSPASLLPMKTAGPVPYYPLPTCSRVGLCASCFRYFEFLDVYFFSLNSIFRNKYCLI